MTLKAKKSLGQNFLIDRNVLELISNCTEIKNKSILEVGPGTGNLTQEIIKKNPKEIFLIEKDTNLLNLLKDKFKDKAIYYNQDILNFSEEKLSKLKDLGADELINYKENPEWGKEVLKLTNNEGVDHVIEVGGGGTFGESVRAAKLGGHIALIGVLSGPAVSEIILPRIFLKQVRLSGIAMANQQSQLAMIEFIEKHNIKPVISDTFDLADLSKAFQHQIDNKHFGKISITMES